jgi:hypothetical protein
MIIALNARRTTAAEQIEKPPENGSRATLNYGENVTDDQMVKDYEGRVT